MRGCLFTNSPGLCNSAASCHRLLLTVLDLVAIALGLNPGGSKGAGHSEVWTRLGSIPWQPLFLLHLPSIVTVVNLASSSFYHNSVP
ncbi:hypothetical protein GE061_007595 [Apolygus lucorum]|uniref:Secreted protein n=1 Tax=Apolygus lucorum TaxID=248454 RepID=A0A8S9WTQ2_APOLU|nr:hypothetical protein GE061_007595 [Apolygus lucorum]